VRFGLSSTLKFESGAIPNAFLFVAWIKRTQV